MERSYGSNSDFGLITNLTVVGKLLLVTDRFVSPHFAVIDPSSGAIVRRLGRDGEGPGEFRDPTPSTIVGEHPGQVWIYDFNNRRLTLLDLHSPERLPILRELPLDVNASLEVPIWVGDRLIANGLFSDFTLLILDRSGRAVSRVSANPPFANRLPNSTGARIANRSFFAADPSHTRMALSYQFANRIDFFRADGTRYGTIAGPVISSRYHYDERGRFRWNDDNEMAHWGIAATSRYVYTLYCGCEMKRVRDAPQTLRVYDWNGRFVAEFPLDRRLTALSVSADDAVLYGGFEDPEPGVGRWKLPPTPSTSANQAS